MTRLVLSFVVAVALLSRPVPASAQGHSPWQLAFGVSLPTISPTVADYPGTGSAGSTVTLGKSGLTFPHGAFIVAAGPVDVEVGYRKLGVLRFSNGNESLKGNTHANALELAARVPLAHRGAFRVQARVGGELVRTIATLENRPATWPFAGGVNTWRLLPLLGLDATLAFNQRWGLRVGYAPVLGTLGTARQTGRFKQQIFSVDLVLRP